MAQLSKNDSPYLPITSLKSCLSGSSSAPVFGIAGVSPRTRMGERTFLASGCSGCADCRAYFHDGFRTLDLRAGVFGGHKTPEFLPVRPHAGWPRLAVSLVCSSHDSSNIGIDNGFGDSKREGPNGSCCVVADARKIEQILQTSRDFASMIGLNLNRGGVQSQSSTGISQSPPRGHDVCFRGMGQVCGVGPSVHPFVPHRFNSGNRGLLEHDLRDHDSPG